MDKALQQRFTEGKLFKNLILFILPIVATNLLQTFYNAADMMVVSLSHEANAVGAIGTTGSFTNLIVNVFIGFSVGTNVVVARNLGADDKDGVQKAVHTSLIMAVIFGFIGAGIGVAVARPILNWMGNSGSLLELAVTYTYIYFAGVPFLALTNYLSAIFRAKGNTKFPLVVLASAGLVNVVLNLFFVLVMGMSVEGVALATMISNIVSFAVLLIRLKKEEDATRFSFKNLKIDRRAFRAIVGIGVPAGLQGALFSISNMLIQSSIVSVNNALVPAGTDYQPVVNGNAAAGNLDGFVYMAMNAVTQGAITFTGQNIGSKKPERVKPILYNCFLISMIIGIVMSALCLVFRTPLLALYGVVQDANDPLKQLAYDTAVKRLLWVCAPYCLCGLMEDCSGVLRGLGRSLTSTVISLIGSCLFRIVWTLVVFPISPTLEIIYVCYPITWLVTSMVAFIVIRLIMRDVLQNRS